MHYAMRPCSTALYVGKTGLVAAVVALALAGSALAGSGIMLQIKDAPLKEVVMMLTQQSGTNIYIADESKLDKKVTVSFNDVPLEKALDYIVKGAGVSYKKMDDGTYIIGGPMAEEITVVPPPASLPPVEPAAEPASYKIKWDSIKLVHSRPSELLATLAGNGATPMQPFGARYPDRTNVRGPNITVSPGGTQVLNGQTGEVIPVGGSTVQPNSQPVAPTIDPRATSSGAGRTAEPTAGAAQVISPPRPYAPGQPTAPTTRPSPTTQGTTGQNFLWPEGVQNAVPFDVDNSIIVMGDDQGIQDFKNIVRMLDVPPKQVQIKAEFVEVKTDEVKSFGIDWSLDKLNESFTAALSGGTGNVVVGFATGNLTASLRTQLTQDVGRIINSPIISTINNQPAYISINSQIPYWTTYNTVTGTGQIIEQATPNFITIDTHLNVLPRVNGDNTITMFLTPGVADTGNIVTGPDGTQIPEQRNQELSTQRRVANGETIVVGGFIRKNDSSSVTKIPVLGDLPIVGSLFRGTSKNTEDRELLIFVTPTIIPDTAVGTIGVGGNLVP
jgi:general secretion pathway protein D